MNKLRTSLFVLLVLTFVSAKADEGMWLLQLMKEQHSIDMMKKQGLLLEADDVYNPNGVSLKDAVGIFGGGCTGEIISSEGLILTNHHCGYDAIQQHSSVEHDYLTDGFWAKNRKEEIPTPGLAFTYIERIEDITDLVNTQIKEGKTTVIDSYTNGYLTKLADQLLAKSDLKGKPGISAQALPFYAGNKYYLMFKKRYSDVRMVAAPPSAIGKFGGETDNWMWPRHTGDFSMFRIYADANGEPAEYSPSNVPLKCKKHLTISLKGVQEGDYAMVMGFPGRTSRYLTASEVKERMEAQNAPRIRVRGARQDVLIAEMNKSDKVRIQYASKYARSCNYWKNSIGMNKAIVDNKVIETKIAQENKFIEFAKSKGNQEYMDVVKKIDDAISKISGSEYQATCFQEVFLGGIEFGTPYLLCDTLKTALDKKDKVLVASMIEKMKKSYSQIHNKDYDHEVDRKVAKALLPLYAEMIPAEQRPAIYSVIEKEFKGDYNKFVDACYDNSIFANQANFDRFIKNPTKSALEKDLMAKYVRAKYDKLKELSQGSKSLSESLALLHKTYVRGLNEMKEPVPSYPDANFTLRLTYGNVKSYDPKDGVHYKYFTTMKGIMEKEDPNNREFTVPAKLKELYNNKDFGRYAMKNGEMPVCFLSTNDITGGNSGSPVINGKGQLIGAAFDGNWESLSGDINFNNDLQRCICVDIRYVLFIVEKLGNSKHLVDEMTIEE
ncbi:S46 family peptidase [uncultured Bacteroides sp.]|uniref:S46 family peptidase n=1 Tax=uncultured Bacteroides sp. TaxID=162156 RepID=UPI002AAB8B7E|nr:S46 family peptidase [uncultured Bacteroides sp.]